MSVFTPGFFFSFFLHLSFSTIQFMFVRSNIHHGRDACCVAFKLGFWDGGSGGGACAGVSLLFFTFYTPFLNYSILSNIVNNDLFFWLR